MSPRIFYYHDNYENDRHVVSITIIKTGSRRRRFVCGRRRGPSWPRVRRATRAAAGVGAVLAGAARAAGGNNELRSRAGFQPAPRALGRCRFFAKGFSQRFARRGWGASETHSLSSNRSRSRFLPLAYVRMFRIEVLEGLVCFGRSAVPRVLIAVGFGHRVEWPFAIRRLACVYSGRFQIAPVT